MVPKAMANIGAGVEIPFKRRTGSDRLTP